MTCPWATAGYRYREVWAAALSGEKAAAVHEAAHAVVLLVHGVAVHEVSIEPTAEESGHVCYAVPPPRVRALCCLAAMHAETAFGFPPQPRLWRYDYQMLDQSLAQLGISLFDRERYGELREEAAALVRRHRGAIQRLAAELLDERTVRAEDLELFRRWYLAPPPADFVLLR